METDEKKCVICLDTSDLDTHRPCICKTYIHDKCMNDMFQKMGSETCPTCRQKYKKKTVYERKEIKCPEIDCKKTYTCLTACSKMFFMILIIIILYAGIKMIPYGINHNFAEFVPSMIIISEYSSPTATSLTEYQYIPNDVCKCATAESTYINNICYRFNSTNDACTESVTKINVGYQPIVFLGSVTHIIIISLLYIFHKTINKIFLKTNDNAWPNPSVHQTAFIIGLSNTAFFIFGTLGSSESTSLFAINVATYFTLCMDALTFTVSVLLIISLKKFTNNHLIKIIKLEIIIISFQLLCHGTAYLIVPPLIYTGHVNSKWLQPNIYNYLIGFAVLLACIIIITVIINHKKIIARIKSAIIFTKNTATKAINKIKTVSCTNCSKSFCCCLYEKKTVMIDYDKENTV